MTPALATAIQAVIDDLANHPAVLVRGPVERLRAALAMPAPRPDTLTRQASKLAARVVGYSWHHIGASTELIAEEIAAAERRGLDRGIREMQKVLMERRAAEGALRPESVV